MTAIEPHAEPATAAPALRSLRLRQITGSLHDSLDQAVKGFAPFQSRESYAHFLQMQYLFQSELQELYHDPELNKLFPDLAQRCRADAARADLADLGLAVPESVPGALQPSSLATALAWIWVSEGSKLGAAILIQRAEAMGLSETFGARHLAEPEGGRMRGWKAFNAIFDSLPFSPSEEADADQGAIDAFSRVQILLQHTYSSHV